MAKSGNFAGPEQPYVMRNGQHAVVIRQVPGSPGCRGIQDCRTFEGVCLETIKPLTWDDYGDSLVSKEFDLMRSMSPNESGYRDFRAGVERILNPSPRIKEQVQAVLGTAADLPPWETPAADTGNETSGQEGGGLPPRQRKKK